VSASAATTLLEFRAELTASPERVYAALTEAQHLAHWFCDQAESDPTEGGKVTLRWTRAGASSEPFSGHWVVLQPPTSCAFEGGHSGYPDGYAGRVGFEIARRGSGSVLITRHLLPARPEYGPIAETYAGAWPRALSRLTAYLTPTA
jgi:uncharacterized protein YndB with AHSA1/START domain